MRCLTKIFKKATGMSNIEYSSFGHRGSNVKVMKRDNNKIDYSSDEYSTNSIVYTKTHLLLLLKTSYWITYSKYM